MQSVHGAFLDAAVTRLTAPDRCEGLCSLVVGARSFLPVEAGPQANWRCFEMNGEYRFDLKEKDH
jgi:hypothetical protein